MKLCESPAELHQRADELVSRRYTLWWALGVLAAEEGKLRDCTWIGKLPAMDEWKRGYDEMREAMEISGAGDETKNPESCPHEITDEECTVGTIAVAPNARPIHPCRRCSRCGNWVPKWIWEQIFAE